MRGNFFAIGVRILGKVGFFELSKRQIPETVDVGQLPTPIPGWETENEIRDLNKVTVDAVGFEPLV